MPDSRILIQDPRKKLKEIASSALSGINNKLFGSNTITTPGINTSWEKMQREFPNETANVRRIGEMGPISKLLYGGAYANTNPLGMININTDLINKDKADIDSVLAHELTHAKQVNQNGILKSLYNNMVNSDSYEDEAYRAEEMRRRSRLGFGRDINLRKE